MPTANLEVVLTAQDKASGTISKFDKTIANVRAGINKYRGVILGATAAITGMVYTTIKLIDAYAVQARAESRLVAGLKNVKGTTEEGIEALKKQANALQWVTRFQDEQIISAQAQLSTFQLSTEQIKALTPRLLDMAAGLEKASGAEQDLESVAIAVGKAMSLGAGSLTRYGVVLDDNQKKMFDQATGMEKINILGQILDQNYKGIAEAVGKNITPMELFNKLIGEMQETAGGAITKAINPYMVKLQDWIKNEDNLNKVMETTTLIVNTAIISIENIAKGFKAITDVIAYPIQKVLEFADSFRNLTDKINLFWEALKRGKITPSIGDFLKGLITPITGLSPLKLIPGLQEGGIVSRPTIAKIGEGGPEAVVPLGRGSIGNTYNFNFSGAFIGNKDLFISEIKRAINRESELRALAGT